MEVQVKRSVGNRKRIISKKTSLVRINLARLLVVSNILTVIFANEYFHVWFSSSSASLAVSASSLFPWLLGMWSFSSLSILLMVLVAGLWLRDYADNKRNYQPLPRYHRRNQPLSNSHNDGNPFIA